MKIIRKIAWILVTINGLTFGQPISSFQIKEGLTRSINNNDSRIIILAGLVGAGIASKYDDSFQKDTESKGLMPKGLAQVGEYWGPAGSLILWGSFIGNSKKEERLQYAVGSFIANGIITYGIKFVTGRTRPDESNRRSFPSGHTSNSFLTATIANEIYGNKVGIPAYTLACITGLSRLQDNKHYASDVIFGAALGTAIGKGFGSIFREINTPKVSINYLKKGFRINIGWTI